MSPDLAQRPLGGQKPPEREPMVRQGPRPAVRTSRAGQSHDTAYLAFSPPGSVRAGVKLGHSTAYSTGSTWRRGSGVDSASLEDSDVCCAQGQPAFPGPRPAGRGCRAVAEGCGGASGEMRNQGTELGEPQVRATDAGRRLRGASPAAASEKDTSFPPWLPHPRGHRPQHPRASRAWTEGGHHTQCFAPDAGLSSLRPGFGDDVCSNAFC